MAGEPDLPPDAGTVGASSFYGATYNPNTDEFGTPCPPASTTPAGPPVYANDSAPGPNPPGYRNREEFRYQILEELGGEGVDVELAEKNLDHALKRALQMWNKHRPLLAWFPFEVPAQDTVVVTFFRHGGPTADERGNPYGFVKRVLDVEWSDQDRRVVGGSTGLVGSGGSYFMRWGYQGPRLFFELSVGERTYERLTGSRPDWRWDPGTRTLYLMSPSRNTRAMVLTSRPRLLEEISHDHESDFITLACGYAKTVLARILGSRGPIPGAAGPIETDSADLRQEGKDQIAEVREMLQGAQSSVPPPRYIG